MTNEEALIWFKDDLKNGKCSDECPQCNAMEKAIEALEKQIPKKPLPHKGWEGKCPTCGVIFLDRTTNYCGNCGQALDWSDTNG